MQIIITVLLISLGTYSAMAKEKLCKFNSFDIAYNQVLNQPPVVLAEFAIMEPISPDENEITCPNIEKFEGQYIPRSNNNCPALKIQMKPDKISLAIDNGRDLNGINTTGITMILVGNAPFWTLSTELVGDSKIVESVITGDNIVMGHYSIESVENGLIVESQNEDMQQPKVCSYIRK